MALLSLSQSPLNAFSAGAFMRQLFNGKGKTLFNIVKIHVTSPVGFLITGSVIFLAGSIGGNWVLGAIRSTFSSLVGRLKQFRTNTEAIDTTTLRTQFPELDADVALYEYDPLVRFNEIRLLELRPQNPTNPDMVICQLHHYLLQDIDPYLCLSYTWGTGARDTDSIYIGGRRFLTSRKVFEMLLDASTWESSSLLVWVDAICINQNDDEEKSKQVAMMRSIYSWAYLVEVWLGDEVYEASDTVLALELIQDVAYTTGCAMAGATREEYMEILQAEAPTEIEGYQFKALLEAMSSGNGMKGMPVGSELLSFQDFGTSVAENIFPTVRKEIFAKYSEPCNQPKLAAFIRLLNDSWFVRVWVIQEVVVPTKVQLRYGTIETTWDSVAAAAIIFNCAEGLSTMIAARKGSFHHTMEGFFSATLMLGIKTSMFMNNEPCSLSTLLGQTAAFGATNPRDKVYALLVITTNRTTHSLLPDYGKSVEQVYTDVARHFIANGEAFFTFNHSGIGNNRKIEGLPSWVPDWTSMPELCLPLDMGNAVPSLSDYRAAVDKPLEIRLNLGGTSMPQFTLVDVKGAEIDTICSVGTFLDLVTLQGLLTTAIQEVAVSLETITKIEECVSSVVTFFDGAQESMKGLNEIYPNGQPLQEAFWRTCVGDNVAGIRPAPEEHRELINALPMFYSKSVESMIESDLETQRRAEIDIELDDTFWDYDENNLPPRAEFLGFLNESFDENAKAMSEWTFEGISPETIHDLAAMTPKASKLYSSLRAMGRKFCVTSKGYIGLVPPKTEVGDLVCLLFGGKTPFLLRTTGEDGKHLLVGECYIHGVMDGEMLSEDLEETWFSLS